MKWIRFAELKARDIVNSWNILRRRIEHDGFPRPRKLGDHIHAWPEAEVQQWLDSRPLRACAAVRCRQRQAQGRACRTSRRAVQGA